MNPIELPLSANAAIFVASAIAVWFAGAKLARYADAIAEHTGIGREVLGLLMLGGITSLPEQAVAVTATLQGTPLLSVSDVLGSAAINLVILAIADAFIGRGALTSVQGSSGVMLQGVLGITVMAMVAASYVTGDILVAGMGVWSWLMLLTYLGCLTLFANSRTSLAWIAHGHQPEHFDREEGGHGTLKPIIWKSVAVAAVILVAGFLLARSGEALAAQTGLGTGFFGMVFLGLSTSLPELSTVLAAVRLRRYEMAISDVFGTNLFNVTIIVLVDAIYSGGPILAEAERITSFGALLALVLTAIYLIGMLERRNRTFLRMGLDSVSVLAAYAVGVVVLHALR